MTSTVVHEQMTREVKKRKKQINCNTSLKYYVTE